MLHPKWALRNETIAGVEKKLEWNGALILFFYSTKMSAIIRIYCAEGCSFEMSSKYVMRNQCAAWPRPHRHMLFTRPNYSLTNEQKCEQKEKEIHWTNRTNRISVWEWEKTLLGFHSTVCIALLVTNRISYTKQIRINKSVTKTKNFNTHRPPTTTTIPALSEAKKQ